LDVEHVDLSAAKRTKLNPRKCVKSMNFKLVS